VQGTNVWIFPCNPQSPSTIEPGRGAGRGYPIAVNSNFNLSSERCYA
jgi:hypothetical protein